MGRLLPFVLVALLSGGCSRPDEVRPFIEQPGKPPVTLSPKLTHFLAEHPGISVTLSNALSEALSGRALEIYYYYTDNESAPKAHHHYMGDSSTVGIFVRENQPACDECISVLFEAVNSKGEKRFRELWEAAKSGAISKEAFVTETLRQEFEAVKRTQSLLAQFRLTDEEVARSQSYSQFANTPNGFKEFLDQVEEQSQGTTRIAYEQLYDRIRRSAQQ